MIDDGVANSRILATALTWGVRQAFHWWLAAPSRQPFLYEDAVATIREANAAKLESGNAHKA
jgi:hypothetical protein